MLLHVNSSSTHFSTTSLHGGTKTYLHQQHIHYEFQQHNETLTIATFLLTVGMISLSLFRTLIRSAQCKVNV